MIIFAITFLFEQVKALYKERKEEKIAEREKTNHECPYKPDYIRSIFKSYEGNWYVINDKTRVATKGVKECPFCWKKLD